MAYQSLQKLFNKDATSDRYARNEALAKERLNAESTFRTGVETRNGELFLAVPRELSMLNERVLRHERRISNALRALPPVAQGALIRGLVVNEVVSTNDLEGVHSTRRQINDLLAGAATSQDRSEVRRFREFANLYLGLSDPNRSFPQAPEDIREIYDAVMRGEDLGDSAPDGRLFRKEGVEVWGTGGKKLHEGLFPERAIIEGMDQMLSIINSDEIPETYGAIVGHYLFEYIHPFYDGNGRTGRYLLALYLSRPLSVVTTLSLSRVIAENRGAYYRSFRDAENPLNHGELTMFVINILENVATAQDEIDEDLARKSGQLTDAYERLARLSETHDLSAAESDALFLLVQLDLFAAFPSASVAEVASHLGLGAQQARRYLTRLEDKGLVRAEGRRPLGMVLSDEARNYFALV